MIDWLKKIFANTEKGQKKSYPDNRVLEKVKTIQIGYVVVYAGEYGWDNPPTKEFTSKKRAFAEAKRASMENAVAVFEVNLNNYDLDLGYDPHGRYGVRKEWTFSVRNPEMHYKKQMERNQKREYEKCTHFVIFEESHGKAHNTFFTYESDAHSFARQGGWRIIYRKNCGMVNGDSISDFDKNFIGLPTTKELDEIEWWEYQNGQLITHRLPRTPPNGK